MKRMSVVLVGLVFLVVILPMGVFAQAIGEPFDIVEINFMGAWFSAEFSPDGNWFAYFNMGHLNLFPVGGGDAVVFNDDIMINGYHAQPIGFFNFSPDSSKLVACFTIYDTTKGSTWNESIDDDGMIHRSSSNGVYTIVTIDLDSWDITYLADGQNPHWSPDGRYIVYDHYDYLGRMDPQSVEHMYGPTMYDILTGDIEFIKSVLLDENDEVDCFVYGPNGDYFYFKYGYNRSETTDDFYARMPVGDVEIEVLTENYGGFLNDLHVSPDGKWGLTHDGFDIIITDLTTGNYFNALTGDPQNQKRNMNESENTSYYSDPFWYPDCIPSKQSGHFPLTS